MVQVKDFNNKTLHESVKEKNTSLSCLSTAGVVYNKLLYTYLFCLNACLQVLVYTAKLY